MDDHPGEPMTGGALHKSRLSVPGMDCPSEEHQIRQELEEADGVLRLEFDLEARELLVWHHGEADQLEVALAPLGFGARLVETLSVDGAPPSGADPAAERRVLIQLLTINALMFVVELGVGLAAESASLIADSLDMFADASVYGLSLRAVGREAADKRRAAKLSGWLQLFLALGALLEVARRAVFGSEPAESLMIGVATVALVANVTCVALLSAHRKGGVHLRASWIFSTNDALANLGVIIAGVMVAVTGAAWPDLVVGTAVAILVLVGAIRILKLR